jgi:hypothetical protein
MGVTVTPHEQDEATGTSRLTVSYGKGSIEAPFRFVNRNDLNAKSTVGADIPLTTDWKPFICEHPINPTGVHGILNTNDYLATSALEVRRTLEMVAADSFRVVYPKLTQNARVVVDASPELGRKIAGFLFDLMAEEPADAYAIHYSLLQEGGWAALENSGSGTVPVIPVVDIEDHRVVERALADVLARAGDRVPFVGFTYAPYRAARLSYERIITARSKLNEKGMGVIVFGTPRTLDVDDQRGADLSAPHYSSFLIADGVGQRYINSGGKGPHVARLFHKAELDVPRVGHGHDTEEHKGEETSFGSDSGLLDLFWRTVKGDNTDSDWKKNFPSAVSRLHEVVASAGEYGVMRDQLRSSELATYRAQKSRLLEWVNGERPPKNH